MTGDERGIGRIAERFYRMVEESPAIMWAYDEVNGRMIYLNPAIEYILGYERFRFYDKPTFWLELIHVNDRPRVSTLNVSMREEKKAIFYIASFKHADGSYLRLLTAVTPICDDRNRIVRTEGAAIPVAESF